MSIARHVRFCLDLPVALWHFAREKYYRIAHDHALENGHPDSTLLCRRMLVSRTVVNDFLSRWTR